MKNKKSIIALIALVVVIGLMIGVYSATRPKTRAEVPQTQPVTQEQPTLQQETQEETQQETEEITTESTVATVSLTVTVVHKDGSEKVFELETDALYLGEVLVEEGIVEGEMGPYGLMISAVDGEVADWNVDQSYWAIFIGEEYATTGADQIPIYGGDVFKLVYTIG